jgi:hypothetical protein
MVVDIKDPTLLDNLLLDGDKAASPTNWPRFTPQKHYFSVSDIHYC